MKARHLVQALSVAALLAVPTVAMAQDQMDANIATSCTATVNNPAGVWGLIIGGNNGNNPAMSVNVLCNTGYSMTEDDFNGAVGTGHMIAQAAGALTGTALTGTLFVTSPDAVNQPLDGLAVAIITPKPRDLDGVAENYVLSYNQNVVTLDPALTAGTYRMVFLFSLTQIPN